MLADYLADATRPKPGDQIAVWFSCGAASAIAAKRTVDFYRGFCDVRVINNPIKQEHADNRRFLDDVSNWIGVEIETATHPDYPDGDVRQIWQDRQFMSSPYGAPCTDVAKKMARQEWERINHHGGFGSDATWLVLGYTADEPKRYASFRKMERSEILPILLLSGTTKMDCYAEVIRAGIRLPAIYDDGFPNANCIGCVKATSPTYWNLVREKYPEVFWDRAIQSRLIGARLVRYKNERIFLDELPPDAVGRPLKNLAPVECGIFCETT